MPILLLLGLVGIAAFAAMSSKAGGLDDKLSAEHKRMLADQLASQRDPAVLAKLATTMDMAGYPRAAAALRARAAQLSPMPSGGPVVPPVAPGSSGPAMTAPRTRPTSPELQATVDQVLAKTTDPAQLLRIAGALEAQGFVDAGAQVRRRAKQLATTQADPVDVVVQILSASDQGVVPGVPGFPPGFGPSPAPGAPIPGTATTPASGRVYVVQEGDNPYQIAQRFTGNGNRYTELAAANPAIAKRILKGLIYANKDQLTLPATWPDTPTAKTPRPKTSTKPTISPAAIATPQSPANSSQASDLASRVLSDLATNGRQYDRPLMQKFQRAAGLNPDGKYGPASRGALEHFAQASAPEAFTGTGIKLYEPRAVA